MAKFYGLIGFAMTSETSPGVWEEQITEKQYCGDLMRDTYRYQSSENLNDNLNISHQISIVADSFAFDNLSVMRYVGFKGAKWKIESIEIQYPRLILAIGGLYNE